MKHHTFMMTVSRAAVALALLTLTAVPASAHDVYLEAKEFPNSEGITMWGFAEDPDGFDTGEAAGAPSSPGPVIRVPAGETTLTINVRNYLAEEISLFVPGQSKSLVPVLDPTAGNRVRSFDFVTDAATVDGPGEAAYRWTNLKSGSYIYQSGTDVRTQIPMGLYGALIVYELGGEAYPGVAPDKEAVLFFSEYHAEEVPDSDPLAYEIVVPAGPGYQPQYFMINGRSFPDAKPDYLSDPDLPVAGQTLLLRFFNIGLDDTMPMLNGLTMQVIAEDGNLLPAAAYLADIPGTPRQHSVLLAAGKTIDALVTPDDGSFAIFDRSLRLDSGPGTVAEGGQIVHLDVALALPPEAPVANADAYSVEELQVLEVAAPGVLTNDTDANGESLTAVLDTPPANGVLTLNPDGSFSYDYDSTTDPFSGTDTFTYFANDGDTGDSAVPATVTITVNPNVAPVATNDDWTVAADATSNIPAPGVLWNDTDDNGDSLTTTLGTDVTGGLLALNADGSFDYTPNALTTDDSFTYTAGDGALDSAEATVNLTVNQVPVAIADEYATAQETELIVIAPGVLDNDEDGDGDPITAILASGPVSGASLVLNADGSFTYNPNPGFNGDDSFTYVANDGNFDSDPATVTITVNAPNAAPVAVDDGEYLVVLNELFTLLAPGLLANDTDPDGDPLTADGATTSANGESVSVGSDGSFTFGPSGTHGADSFTYVADDGSLNSNVATVSIWVNERPEARDDSVTSPRRRFWINVVANDTDGDGTIAGATVEIVTPPNPAVGSIIAIDTTGADAGRVRYQYNTNGLRNTGDSFTYRVRDDRGTWSNTVTVEVNGGP